MQRWLRFLYVLFILSIPLKNVVFQVSIGLINLLFLITIFQGREAVLFLKSLRWLCLCLACLAFSMALSSILGITGMEGWREVLKHVLRFWLFLLATIYFLRQGWISRAFVGRWVLAVLFFHAVLGWIQFFWAEDFFRFIGDMDWGGRLTGVLANPNSYGFLMALAVVCSFSLVIGRRQEQGKGFLQSVFLILLFVMAFWPLLQSGSRGAWLGALAGACAAGSAVRGFWLQKSTVLLFFRSASRLSWQGIPPTGPKCGKTAGPIFFTVLSGVMALRPTAGWTEYTRRWRHPIIFSYPFFLKWGSLGFWPIFFSLSWCWGVFFLPLKTGDCVRFFWGSLLSFLVALIWAKREDPPLIFKS
jgi:hypothetical protein